jgi:hypothetical protein
MPNFSEYSRRLLFGNHARATFSIVFALISFIASSITIVQVFGKSPQDIRIVEGGPEEIVLSGNTEPFVRAKKIIVPANLQLPHDQLVLLANKIEFKNDAVLIAPGKHVIVIASQVSGGAINVSGADAAQPGMAGEKAGSILIRAGDIRGTQLIAAGGDGADGSQGGPGSPGRNGRCDGFGAWRPAERGGAGQSGNNGGDGGDGGVVSVKIGELSVVPVIAAPGLGGRGGPGGPGGPGGRGCSGLGGTQTSRSEGPYGAAGANGAPGAETEPRIGEFDFKAFARSIRASGQSLDVLMELVQ